MLVVASVVELVLAGLPDVNVKLFIDDDDDDELLLLLKLNHDLFY